MGAAEVQKEIAFFLERKETACYFAGRLDREELPIRVTHNDTKLNNVMLDDKTGKGVCVIDLDTVMPGLAMNDFGDAIRYGRALRRRMSGISPKSRAAWSCFPSLPKDFWRAAAAA